MTSCTSRAIVKESLSLKLHFTKKKNEAHIYNETLVKQGVEVEVNSNDF